MNRVILFPQELNDSKQVVIDDPLRLRHLRDVLRVKPGSEIRVSVLEQGIGSASVLKTDQGGVVLKLENLMPGSLPWLSVFLGLCRPPTLKKIFEHGTCMGVGAYHLVQGTLSEKSFWKSSLLQKERYRNIWNLGISQSNIYYQSPQLFQYGGTRELRLEECKGSRIFLDPEADALIADVGISFEDQIHLAIGPERGWTASEADLFQNAGFIPVRISSTTLRVEHALFHAIGQLELLRLKERMT